MDELAPDEDAASGADYRSLTKRLQAVSEPVPDTPLGTSPDTRQGTELCMRKLDWCSHKGWLGTAAWQFALRLAGLDQV